MTIEEIKELKQECEMLANKLSELSEEELKQVTGGVTPANLYFIVEELKI